MIFRHAGFKEVFLLAEINRLAHPRERIFRAKFHGQTDAFKPAVSNVLDVFAEQSGVQAENPARQTIFRIGDFQFDRLLDERPAIRA